MIAGLFLALAYAVALSWWAYQDSIYSGQGCWLLSLPWGLSLPVSIRFLAELGTGWLMLLLLGILLRRTLPSFVRGMLIVFAPCTAALILVLLTILSSIPPGSFRSHPAPLSPRKVFVPPPAFRSLPHKPTQK